MFTKITRTHREALRGTDGQLIRPDRPRAIERVIRYFGDVPAPVLVSVARALSLPLRQRRSC